MATYDLTAHHIIELGGPIALSTEKLQVFYGRQQAIFDATLNFPANQITALIGASGSGKSTYLRSLNRMNDKVARVTGKIMYQETNINDRTINVYAVRRHLGMVFQRPNPFAKSIYDNLTFALKATGIKSRTILDDRVEQSLKEAALWEEVKKDLHKSALALSGGQQQRLCIARALATQPEILLLDEPASALDPISTAKIEVTLKRLAERYTIIIVTHNMQQAARLSSYTAFLHLGHLIEFDKTPTIFQNPEMTATQDYITGNFG
ncbi:phosphate ABC transporter ATP-binding protein PstB [Secundilactobacillus kimchicus]|uniref:phosphate ABC transporter ATP-binding protein PstB n=1 Tax=Secundilactobacillus kimchicus TaxID=528209 RepID=UPI0024A7C97C|nr:phosphate ABC transporter ATP-binding protein PstB [Secundilactobacillus kimchicus]